MEQNTGGIWRLYYIDLHYKLSVAQRALPRKLLVARHIKVVVLGVREDDMASPVMTINITKILVFKYS